MIYIIKYTYIQPLGNIEHFEEPFKGSTTNLGNMSIAVFASMFSYGGWLEIIVFTFEISVYIVLL